MNPAILVYAGLAFGIFGAARDVLESMTYIFYGQTEGNKWTRDEFTMYSLWRGILYYAGLLGIAIIPWLIFNNGDLIGSLFAGGYMAGVGLFGLVTAKGARRHSISNRKVQYDFITRLKPLIEANDSLGIDIAFTSQMLETVRTRSWFVYFGWLYSDKKDLNEAWAECKAKVIEFVRSGARFPK